MARRPATPVSPPGFWSRLPGYAAIAVALLVPFIPDQKVSRLKLEALELSLLAMLIAVSLRAFFSRETGCPEKKLAFAVGAWLLITAALSLLSPDRSLAFHEVGRVATSVAAFFAMSLSALEGRNVRRFLLSWTAAAALVSLYGVLQYNGGAGPLLVPQMDRPIGAFGNPIFFSAFLVPSLFLALAAWRMSTANAERALLAVAMGLEALALALTQTRSAYLALGVSAVALGLMGTKYPKVRLLAGVAVVLCAVGVGTIGKRDQAHGLIWRDTIKMWKQSPATGVGLGAFHVHLRDVAGEDLKAKWPAGQSIVNYAHNEYLQTLAEGGPLALAALLAVLLSFLLLFRRQEELVFRLIGVAALAGFVQNMASADFRFGISEATSFLLMGLFSSRNASGDAEIVALPSGARSVAAAGALALLVVGGIRVSQFSGEKAAAVAPGFFDERVVNPEKAISDLESLNHQQERDPARLEQLAFVYAKQMRRVDGTLDADMGKKAIYTFRAVIDLNGSRAPAHNNLANALFTMGQPEAAAPEWRRAAELDDHYVDPRLNLGKTAYIRGDLKEAARWFQDVLKIDPSNAEAALYLRRMVE